MKPFEDAPKLPRAEDWNVSDEEWAALGAKLRAWATHLGAQWSYHPLASSQEGFVPSTVLGDATGTETGQVLFDSEPIMAYRAWKLDKDDRMTSTAWRIHWPVRKPMRAHCLTAFAKFGHQRFTKSPHSCPFLGHSCGIYAALDYDWATTWGTSQNPRGVLGTVSLWGRVLRFEKGYRAEYAYPAGFFRSPQAEYDVEELADRYGVQVLDG